MTVCAVLFAASMMGPYATGEIFSISNMCWHTNGDFAVRQVYPDDIPGFDTNTSLRITQSNARAIMSIADGALERIVLPQTRSTYKKYPSYYNHPVAYPDRPLVSCDFERVPYEENYSPYGSIGTNYFSITDIHYANASNRDFNTARTVFGIKDAAITCAKLLRDGGRDYPLQDVVYGSSMIPSLDGVYFRGETYSNAMSICRNAITGGLYRSMHQLNGFSAKNRQATSLNSAIQMFYALRSVESPHVGGMVSVLSQISGVDIGPADRPDGIFDLHSRTLRFSSHPFLVNAAAVALVDKTYDDGGNYMVDYEHNPMMSEYRLKDEVFVHSKYSPTFDSVFWSEPDKSFFVSFKLGGATGSSSKRAEITSQTLYKGNQDVTLSADGIQTTSSYSFSANASFDYFFNVAGEVGPGYYRAEISGLPGGESGSVTCTIYWDDGDVAAQFTVGTDHPIIKPDDVTRSMAEIKSSVSEGYGFDTKRSPSLTLPGGTLNPDAVGDIGFMAPNADYYSRIERVILQHGVDIYRSWMTNGSNYLYYAGTTECEADEMSQKAFDLCEMYRTMARDMFISDIRYYPNQLDEWIDHLALANHRNLAERLNEAPCPCMLSYTPIVGYIEIYGGTFDYSLFDKNGHILPILSTGPGNRFATHSLEIGGTFNKPPTYEYNNCHYDIDFSRAIYWKFSNLPIGQ